MIKSDLESNFSLYYILPIAIFTYLRKIQIFLNVFCKLLKSEIVYTGEQVAFL